MAFVLKYLENYTFRRKLHRKRILTFEDIAILCFQNSEPPIICYKYNKPIRNTVFNFNKLVSDLDIHANIPKS